LRQKKTTYEIGLLKRGRPYFFYGTLLDGLFDKEFILHTRSDFVERLGLCDKCYGCMTHVIINNIDPGGYTNKFCPVLFQDLNMGRLVWLRKKTKIHTKRMPAFLP